MPGQVLVDARALQGPSADRGIGTYVRNLLGALAALPKHRPLAVLVDGALPPPELPDGIAVHEVRRRYRGRLAGYEDAAVLGGDLDRIRPAAFHATTLSLPSRSPCPTVVTLHDLIPWAWGGPWMVSERLRYFPGKRLLARAEAVIAVSDTTAADAIAHANVDRDRIEVIPEGVDARFHPDPAGRERVLDRWGLREPYLFYVGALDRRKDPVGLVRAWRAATRLGVSAPLVIAGSPGRSPGGMGGATLLGHVTDAELADLYRGAACLVFPSRYEGFGLPVLEAMASGCPVVAYDTPAVSEVAGGAARLVPVGNAPALGQQVALLATDAEARETAVAAGLQRAGEFTWRRTAAATAALYDRVLRQSSR